MTRYPKKTVSKHIRLDAELYAKVYPVIDGVEFRSLTYLIEKALEHYLIHLDERKARRGFY